MIDPVLVPLIQRLDRDPGDEGALAELWHTLASRRQYEQLATIGEKIAVRRRDPVSAADLYARVGALWENDARRDDKAALCYERAVQLDPGAARAAHALGALHLRLGRVERALHWYNHALAHEQDPARRASLLEDVLDLRERQGDAEGQLEALRELHRLRPSERDLAMRLLRLLVERTRAGRGGEAERIEAARVLGSLAPGAHPAAQRHKTAEAALALWPGEEQALALLEDEYAALGRSDELLPKRVAFLGANPTSPLAPRVRRALADQYARAGRLGDAIEVLEPLRGSDALATRALADLYHRAGRLADLASLEAEIDAAAGAARDIGVLRTRAALLREAGDRQGFVATLREIVRLDPSDESAIEDLARELRARGAFAELRDLLIARCGSRPEVRRARLREAALLAEQRLGDVDGACAAWEAIAETDPHDLEASLALERLLAGAKRWAELAAHLARRAHATLDPSERRALVLRQAEVLRDKLGAPREEADALGSIWNAHPDDEQIALLLAAARRRAGDSAGTEAVLRALVDAASPVNAAPRWAALANHLEWAGRAGEAREAWQRARTLDPRDELAWESEQRLAEAAGDRRALLESLLARATHPLTPGRRAAGLFVRAARVARDLGEKAAALSYAERALRFAPADAELAVLLAELRGEVGRDSDDKPAAESEEKSVGPSAETATLCVESTSECQESEKRSLDDANDESLRSDEKIESENKSSKNETRPGGRSPKTAAAACVDRDDAVEVDDRGLADLGAGSHARSGISAPVLPPLIRAPVSHVDGALSVQATGASPEQRSAPVVENNAPARPVPPRLPPPIVPPARIASSPEREGEDGGEGE